METEQEKDFIRDVALQAFRHGRDYVEGGCQGADFNPQDTPDNELPFAEWYAMHFGIDSINSINWDKIVEEKIIPAIERLGQRNIKPT